MQGVGDYYLAAGSRAIVADIYRVNVIGTRGGIAGSSPFVNVEVGVVTHHLSGPLGFLFARVALIKRGAGSDLHGVGERVVLNASYLGIELELLRNI